LANFCGRGLVAKDNRPMKLLNHDTRHFSRHDSDDKKVADDKDADALMLLYFLTAKQHKSGPYGSAVGYSTGFISLGSLTVLRFLCVIDLFACFHCLVCACMLYYCNMVR